MVALIGANGAGKTTLLRAIRRIVEPSEGSIHFDGTDLGRVGPPEAVALGIAHSPEGRRVLARQSVRDNLLLGAWTRRGRRRAGRRGRRLRPLSPAEGAGRQPAGTSRVASSRCWPSPGR